MTQSEFQELEQLRKENAILKAAKASAGTGLKVSPKGALSLYGLGRFPVTLYREQWENLFSKQDDIKAFIVANADALKVKERTAPQ